MLNSTRAADSDEGGEKKSIPPQGGRRVSLHSGCLSLLLILAAWVIICNPRVSGHPLRGQPQKEISKEDLINLLEAGVAPKRIESLVEERGVSFELTPEVEQNLRVAGADTDLIGVIRAYARPPAPPELIVESKPGAANVYADSRLVAKTSSGGWAKITTLSPGRHILRITAESYDDFQQSIDLQSGKLLTIRAELKRAAQAPPILLVNSRPSGAAVSVDSRLIGATDDAGRIKISDLSPGKHLVRVSAEGHADFEQSVELASGKTTAVTAALQRAKPATAGLVLESVVRGASVAVDGRLVDKSSPGGSLNIPELSPGKHTVRITAEGYAPFEQTVNLGPGSVLKLRTPLLPLAPSPGLARLNAIDGLKYVWIPPGTFMMGCSPGESQQCLDDERPSHRVTIGRAFWLGQTEVTVAAYKRFAEAKGLPMPAEPVFGSIPLNPGWANEQKPMVNVNRADAEAYCGWAGGRLPTEAEWEHAARAGSTEGRYGPVDEIAWYADNSGRARLDSELIWRREQSKFSDRLNENGNTFHAIMQKKPNAYNLYDILGNVWEWVSDWYDEKYYSHSPELDPRGPSTGEFGILRGGSWFTGPRVSRAAPRYKILPQSFGFAIGIRCARDAAP